MIDGPINNLCSQNSDLLQIGLDIGGTLTKLAIVLRKNNDFLKEKFIEFGGFEEVELEESYLYIRIFSTNKFQTEAVPLLQILRGLLYFTKIHGTGGGAHRFASVISEEFQIKIEKHDELLSLVNGYIFMNRYNSFYEVISQGTYNMVSPEDFEYPHIAVNIGSGVSILKVSSPSEVKRVTGTLMGGGTLIGLSKLLINVDNYNDILALAKNGNNKNVDLLVKDIYGGSALGLDSDIIASTFGKIHNYIQVNKKDSIQKEDIAQSLLAMICYHIGQLAYLVGKESNIKKIYYFGYFSRRNSYAIEWLDIATKFWNSELFVRFNYYDGYLGSIGTLVMDQSELKK